MLDGHTGLGVLSATLPIVRNQPFLKEKEPEINPGHHCEIQTIGRSPFTTLRVVKAKTDGSLPIHVRQFATPSQLNEIRVFDDYSGRLALCKLDANAVVAAQRRRRSLEKPSQIATSHIAITASDF
jgi:hypothetical protein